jgi:Reverse transcriptase (RNA-dependent DNA polymerase)
MSSLLRINFLSEIITILIIYVDDIIITGDDQDEIKRLQEQLCKEFEMKDLG